MRGVIWCSKECLTAEVAQYQWDFIMESASTQGQLEHLDPKSALMDLTVDLGIIVRTQLSAFASFGSDSSPLYARAWLHSVMYLNYKTAALSVMHFNFEIPDDCSAFSWLKVWSV